MSVVSMLTQTVTWSNAPGTTSDTEGNWTPGAITTTEEPCHLQPFTAEESFAQGTDQTITRYHLFLSAETVATARSVGVIGGARYQVEGKPAVWTTPRGGPHHAEAVAVRIEE